MAEQPAKSFPCDVTTFCALLATNDTLRATLADVCGSRAPRVRLCYELSTCKPCSQPLIAFLFENEDDRSPNPTLVLQEWQRVIGLGVRRYLNYALSPGRRSAPVSAETIERVHEVVGRSQSAAPMFCCNLLGDCRDCRGMDWGARGAPFPTIFVALVPLDDRRASSFALAYLPPASE